MAKRYLAGESMATLAEEHGINHSFLHKTMMERCGTNWSVDFRADDLNIRETVPIEIPRLLDDKTIRAIQKKAQSNRTFSHGHLKHKYLFARMVFCEHCGHALTGQTNAHGERYYRHGRRDGAKKCVAEIGWVRADDIEKAVVLYLFECFGNPKAVQRAIEAALPNRERITESRKRIAELELQLQKNKAARAKHQRTLDDDLVPEEEVIAKLAKLKLKDDRERGELERLQDSLENVPSADIIRGKANEISTAFTRRRKRKTKARQGQNGRAYTSARLTAKLHKANDDLAAMTWEEKRALSQMVFSGKTSTGKRMGIYIERPKGDNARRNKNWKFTIRGHFIEEEGLIHAGLTEDIFSFGAAPSQKKLVANSVCHSRGPDPPGRRFPRRPRRLGA